MRILLQICLAALQARCHFCACSFFEALHLKPQCTMQYKNGFTHPKSPSQGRLRRTLQMSGPCQYVAAQPHSAVAQPQRLMQLHYQQLHPALLMHTLSHPQPIRLLKKTHNPCMVPVQWRQRTKSIGNKSPTKIFLPSCWTQFPTATGLGWTPNYT